ncbi:MAG: 6-carboxytetrahydropterin synthase [Thermoanaerobaculia bacterium]|nr:6-carboxytetrahydropterin synthase [Thermoanaerobaculia bacterium]
MIVTARLQFAAAHRLHNEAFDDEWNRSVFDKCDNPAGHGHNYVLEVSVSGPVDPDTGMVIDLKRLKGIIRERVIDRVDHKNLNIDVDFLEGVNPTAENLAVSFWQELEQAVQPCKLEQIVLRETEKNSVTYRGE